MDDYFREDIQEHEGRSYQVRYFYDIDHGVPWEGEDGRGIVTDWMSDHFDKKPGWRPLHETPHRVRYFDWAGTIAKAKLEDWGLGGEELAELTGKLGRLPAKGEITERAVQNEFDFYRAYCRDEWHYVGIEVTALIDGEPDDELQDTCWGFESWKGYHETAAAEMVAQLDGQVVQALAERAAKEERDAAIREKAREDDVGFYTEIYDDAHVDEVDDGYWVTAKIFVPKESQ